MVKPLELVGFDAHQGSAKAHDHRIEGPIVCVGYEGRDRFGDIYSDVGQDGGRCIKTLLTANGRIIAIVQIHAEILEVGTKRKS